MRPVNIEKVISGGQTGVDQAGLKAARAAGIPTGGYAPRGWLVETGSAPWLGPEFGLVECQEPGGSPSFPVWRWNAECYRARTEANARESDGTIWLGSGDTRGFGCTMNACRKAKKLTFGVMTRGVKPQEAADWIREHGIAVLNVAGNRESSSPGIGDRAERFLVSVFRRLGHGVA